MNKGKKARIIFSDIDGTLLPWTGKDLSGTAELFAGLIRRGIVFVPCTGRGIHNIPSPILNIPGLHYAITANGALVVDLTTGKALRERMVSPELAGRLLTFARKRGGTLFCYREGVHYIDNINSLPDPETFPGSLKDWVNSVIVTDFSDLIAEGIPLDKMGLFCDDPDFRERFTRELKASSLWPELSVSSSAFWNIELNAAGANKGDAALWLTKELGFSPEKTIAAGDNLNDLAMLSLGGISIAPENALPEVKAAVSEVVPDCREDGVENYLKAYFAEF